MPEGYESLLRLTAPVNLWDRIISGWVPWMREHQPSVALRLEGSFPDTAIDQLIEGLLDICILYAPRSRPGVVIETLAEEQVVLVRHAGRTAPWAENYILVDWGAEFRAEHERVFPKMTAPPISTGLTVVGLRYVLDRRAAGYLPLSVVASHIEKGDLKRVEGAPVFLRPVYLAYPSNGGKTDVLESALAGLRELATNWVTAVS